MQTNLLQPAASTEANDSRPASDKAVVCKELLGDVMMSAIGQIFVFDAQGEQVAELQKTPIILWAENAERLGYNVDGLKIKTMQHMLTLRRSEYGWNFEVS